MMMALGVQAAFEVASRGLNRYQHLVVDPEAAWPTGATGGVGLLDA
jgi:hypothetical protein